MGFFDRFTRTFRSKKDADADEVTHSAQAASYSTLSLFAPELTPAKVSPTEFAQSATAGAVAVAACGPLPDPICWPSDHEGNIADLNCG